jgi:glutamate dehydrogenase/leucine dehydrogenase
MTGKHSDTTGTSGTGKTADHLAKLIEMSERNDIVDPEGIDPETLVEAASEERFEEFDEALLEGLIDEELGERNEE